MSSYIELYRVMGGLLQQRWVQTSKVLFYISLTYVSKERSRVEGVDYENDTFGVHYKIGHGEIENEPNVQRAS